MLIYFVLLIELWNRDEDNRAKQNERKNKKINSMK